MVENSGTNGSEEKSLVLRTPQGILTRQMLDAESEQRLLLKEFISKHMVDGTDYGVIPGTEKPTLLKPGAEKLVDIFRCEPRFKLMERIEDFGNNLFAYTFRVQLVQRDAGAMLAEGYGSANSREGRYRWRNASPKCPTCGKEALFRSKDKPGFYCWAKKFGCGAKFAADDAAVLSAFAGAGKVENDDVATLANTILKMAKKRALVDGAIAMARVSDLFTQDAEDMDNPPPDDRFVPEPDEHSIALHEELKQAMHAARDAKSLWTLAEKAKDAFKKRKLNEVQNNDLVAVYKQRSNELAPGAAK